MVMARSSRSYNRETEQSYWFQVTVSQEANLHLWIQTNSTDLQLSIITQEFLRAFPVKKPFEEESKVGKWLCGGSTDYLGRRHNINASLRQHYCAYFEKFNFEFSTYFYLQIWGGI